MVLLVLSFKEKRKSFFPSLLLLALFLIMGGDLRYFFSSSILHFSRLARLIYTVWKMSKRVPLGKSQKWEYFEWFFPELVFWWICGLSRRSKAMLSTFLVDLSQCWTQSDPFGTSNIKWDYCVACTEYVFFFRQNITWWLNDKNNKRSLVALLGLRSYLRT